MPIHDVSYQRWQGRRTDVPPAFIMAMAQLRLAIRRRVVRIVLLLSGLFVVAFIGMLYVETTPEDSAVAVLKQVPFIRLDSTSMLRFLTWQRMLHYVLCLAAGVGYIARDRRAKAVQLYLARPVRVQDYILGKGLPLAVLLSVTTWVPALILILLKCLATASLEWLTQEPWLPLSILAYSALLVVSLVSLTLAISSLTTSPIMAAVMLASFFLFVPLLAELFRALTRNDTWQVLSMQASLEQLCHWLFDARLPHDFSPWSALFALALLTTVCLLFLMRRVRAVDIVGGG
ncbi:MAG: ABC transporter permease subunit [Candidatus Latescibacterota bacterium]|nr:MAG: ABC transporter permease subunit [Candidatus Latescibacterota bacterium]